MKTKNSTLNLVYKVNNILLLSFIFNVISFNVFNNFDYNIVYANSSYNEKLSTNKLTNLQNTFFKLIVQKENNKNIKKNDIENLLSGLNLKEKIKRKGDYVYIYSSENELLSIVTKTDDKSSVVDGFAYRLSNPTKDISVIKMQYYNENKYDRLINIQVSSENQDSLYNLFSKIDPEAKNSELYTNYLDTFNSLKKNDINKSNLSAVNSRFEFVNSPNRNNSSFYEYEVNGSLNENLVVRVDKKSKQLNELNFNRNINRANNFNTIYSVRKEYEGRAFITNYNLSNDTHFGYIIRVERDCASALEQEFLNILNNIY